jgi:hypothetical protein
MEFKEWFCLRQRDNFTIDAKINPSDAQFYFGRDTKAKQMLRQIGRSFIVPGVPKMMIYGAYGSGKTQTLYWLAYELSNNPLENCKLIPYPVHLDVEVQSKAMAANWHMQNMEAIGMQVIQEWVQKIQSLGNFDLEIKTLTNDPNIQQAFKHLLGSGSLAFNSWRWLSAQKLSANDLREINITRNLGEGGVAGDMVNVLQTCGNLAKAVGICLILLVDEMEEVINIREGDAAESWHQYIRKLSDNANFSVGFIFGFMAVTLDQAPRMLWREDVRNRIGAHNYIELEALSAVANVKKFVNDMLERLVDRDQVSKVIQSEGLADKTSAEIYPFTTSAFDLLCDYACQDPMQSTPRNIIRTINECAIAAWDSKKKIVDDAIVNDIAPIVFS